MRKLIFKVILLIPYIVISQIQIPKCNFDSLELKRYDSENYYENTIKLNKQFENFLKNYNNNSNIFTIPVVFHILENPEIDDMNISNDDIHNQLEILNDAYNFSQFDSSLVPSEFQLNIGNPRIEFCIASVDPWGYITNGINRIQTDINIFSSSLDNIKYTNQGGSDSWNTQNYLNIWIGNITTGILGYADRPSSSNPDNEDGVVVGYKYFGESSHQEYGMGKTLIHEVGHYFNLIHPWGMGNCENFNDGVSDTPTSESAYYGNPSYPQFSCNSSDMFMNYMEYVNDSSMVMFSQGQVARMHFAINMFRSSLLESNGCGIPSLIVQTNLNHCTHYDSQDGSINLNILSGVEPFQFFWEDGFDQNSLYNLSVGDYNVIITDSIGQELNLDINISYYGNVYDSDNFESYNIDSPFVFQSYNWFPLCEDSFSANIYDISPVEGFQYLEINSNDGSNSFMREIANTGINAYNISFKLYVPSSRSASFSIYHDLSCNNLDRSYKVNFSGNGLGNVINNNTNLNFSFFNNQWFELSQLIDLDRNIVELYINNNFLLDWQFNSSIHDNYNYNQLGGIVFHSDTDSLNQLHYFIDDYKLSLNENSDLYNFSESNVSDIKLYPNPTKKYFKLDFGKFFDIDINIKLVNNLGLTLFEKLHNPINGKILYFDLNNYPEGVYFCILRSSNLNKTFRVISY